MVVVMVVVVVVVVVVVILPWDSLYLAEKLKCLCIFFPFRYCQI
jgi:hypothetical protein